MSSIQNDLLSGDTWRIFFLKLILFNVCGISNLSTTWFTTAHGYMEMGHISLTRLRVAWEHSSASHPGWGRHSGSIAHAETRKSDSNQLVTARMNMPPPSCTATSPEGLCCALLSTVWLPKILPLAFRSSKPFPTINQAWCFYHFRAPCMGKGSSVSSFSLMAHSLKPSRLLSIPVS